MSWLLSKLSAAKFAMRVARACMKTRSFLRSKIICPFKGPRAELNSSDSLSRLRGTYSTISVRSSFDRGGRAALIGVHIYLNVNCMPDGIVVRKIGPSLQSRLTWTAPIAPDWFMYESAVKYSLLETGKCSMCTRLAYSLGNKEAC